MTTTQGGTDGPGGQDPPSAPWHFHRLICDARGIGRGERLVLFALLRWIDADGRAWPAVETIAGAAGLSRRWVQDALGELEVRKVIVAESDSRGGVDATGRGRPTRWRIDWRALATLAPIDTEKGEPRTPLASAKGERRDRQERTARPRRANGATLKGEPGSPKPSIHSPLNNQKNHHENGAACVPGMDGMGPVPDDLRAELGRCGIKGPNLDRLAASPRLTPEVVREEAERINTDPGVKRKPGALYRRLADLAGIAGRGGKAAPVGAAVADALARMTPAEREQAEADAARLDALRQNRAKRD
jgi:hypothetical protein